MYHFIEVLDIDELVDISGMSEAEQDQFMNDFMQTAVANTYTHYLEDPEIPEEEKEKVVRAIEGDGLTPEEHQKIFAGPYLQGLYEQHAYDLKVDLLQDFLSDMQAKATDLEEDVATVFLDYVEYLSSAISAPEEEQEPETEVAEAWKDFKAICIAKLDMFKD